MEKFQKIFEALNEELKRKDSDIFVLKLELEQAKKEIADLKSRLAEEIHMRVVREKRSVNSDEGNL